MPLSHDDALAKLRRIFPGHEITVHDEDGPSECGLVEATDGTTIASFCLTLKEPAASKGSARVTPPLNSARVTPPLNTVSKIRLGPVGQFCGTADQQRHWQQSQSDPLYLDSNATTPLDPRVLVTMIPWFLAPSNAGCRTHRYGQRAKDAVETARRHIAEVVGAQPEEVFFTSGATESNNIALLGLAQHGERTGKKHILSTAIEHKAVLEPLDRLRQLGFDVELAPVTAGGYVEPDAIARRLRPDTLLVSVMHANNETGVLQPVHEICDLLRARQSSSQTSSSEILFHTDAAQTFGKLVPELKTLPADMISISSHKIYGPQGIGALVVRRRGLHKRPVQPLTFGGGQERGLRPGTVPVALAVGLGEAARLAGLEWSTRRTAALAIRHQLLRDLAAVEHHTNGDPTRSLPHVLNISFPGIDSEAFMLATKDSIAISNGSACTSASYKPSHVLEAMGLNETKSEAAIRLSWGHAQIAWPRCLTCPQDHTLAQPCHS